VIRVLIVDDHQLVRIGTSRLLEDVERLEIIANADSDEQAIEFVQQLWFLWMCKCSALVDWRQPEGVCALIRM
jgi:CheY-like chemotaxis protein